MQDKTKKICKTFEKESGLMPTGLKVPVRVDESGGAAIERDESKQLDKMLILAFSEGDDNNPFQNLGLDKTLIFSVQSAAFRGRAIRAIDLILAKFRDRVELAPDSPIKFEDKGNGEVEVSFEYIDLFTDKVETFRIRVRR